MLFRSNFFATDGMEQKDDWSFRRSNWFDRLKELGAVFGQKFGWERANWFAPSKELQKIIGERNFNSDNGIQDKSGKRSKNVNVYPIKEIMKLDILQTTKKSKPVYNYNALATNTIMNYTIFKVGDDYQQLLNKFKSFHSN